LKGKDSYVIKVADFGLSHISESDNYNLKAEAKFPIRWSAPEVMTRGQVSKMSDVWSFGIVMWEILEWKKPYSQVSLNSDVMKMVCNEGLRLTRPTRVDVPDEFWEIIQSCWNSDPKKRPTFQELYRQLGGLEIKMGKEDMSSFLSSSANHQGGLLNYLRSPPTDEKGQGKSKSQYEQTPSSKDRSHYDQTPAKDQNHYDQTPTKKDQKDPGYIQTSDIRFDKTDYLQTPMVGGPSVASVTSNAEDQWKVIERMTNSKGSKRNVADKTDYLQTPNKSDYLQTPDNKQ